VLGTMSPPDHRLSYSMGPPMQVSNVAYDSPPSLPPLDRQPSWSNQPGVPATAITALLTEDKCPRHSEYCTNAGCYGNH
jgi:hypothetical protein